MSETERATPPADKLGDSYRLYIDDDDSNHNATAFLFPHGLPPLSDDGDSEARARTEGYSAIRVDAAAILAYGLQEVVRFKPLNVTKDGDELLTLEDGSNWPEAYGYTVKVGPSMPLMPIMPTLPEQDPGTSVSDDGRRTWIWVPSEDRDEGTPAWLRIPLNTLPEYGNGLMDILAWHARFANEIGEHLAFASYDFNPVVHANCDPAVLDSDAFPLEVHGPDPEEECIHGGGSLTVSGDGNTLSVSAYSHYEDRVWDAPDLGMSYLAHVLLSPPSPCPHAYLETLHQVAYAHRSGPWAPEEPQAKPVRETPYGWAFHLDESGVALAPITDPDVHAFMEVVDASDSLARGERLGLTAGIRIPLHRLLGAPPPRDCIAAERDGLEVMIGDAAFSLGEEVGELLLCYEEHSGDVTAEARLNGQEHWTVVQWTGGFLDWLNEHDGFAHFPEAEHLAVDAELAL